MLWKWYGNIPKFPLHQKYRDPPRCPRCNRAEGSMSRKWPALRNGNTLSIIINQGTDRTYASQSYCRPYTSSLIARVIWCISTVCRVTTFQCCPHLRHVPAEVLSWGWPAIIAVVVPREKESYGFIKVQTYPRKSRDLDLLTFRPTIILCEIILNIFILPQFPTSGFKTGSIERAAS